MSGPPAGAQAGDRGVGNGDVHCNGPGGLGRFGEGEQDCSDSRGEIVFTAREGDDGADVGPPEVEELARPEPAQPQIQVSRGGQGKFKAEVGVSGFSESLTQFSVELTHVTVQKSTAGVGDLP